MSDHRALVLDEVRKYHQEQQRDAGFVPGVTEIWPSGAVLDAEDRVALVEAALEMRIAAGRSSRKFESAFARRLKRRKAHLTNSGSSANLLAVSALTSHLLEDRRLRPGDEVITVAAGFPTTVNPILQNGLVPVFVDVDLATYNTTADRVAQAIGPRTRAIIIAHALGNPFEVAGIAELAAEHELFLIEDNCDAVGSTYDGRLTGTFGDLTTVSFYPAHHLTMGRAAVSSPRTSRWPGSWSRCATGAGTAGASRARTTSASSVSSTRWERRRPATTTSTSSRTSATT